MRKMTLIAAPLSVGSTYLHSPSRQKLAEQAQADFLAIVREPAFPPGDQKFREFQSVPDRISVEIHQIDQTTQLSTLLSRKWPKPEESTLEALTRATTDLQDAESELALTRTALCAAWRLSRPSISSERFGAPFFVVEGAM